MSFTLKQAETYGFIFPEARAWLGAHGTPATGLANDSRHPRAASAFTARNFTGNTFLGASPYGARSSRRPFSAYGSAYGTSGLRPAFAGQGLWGNGGIARDASLAHGGMGSASIPAEFGAYVDPQVIDILTSPQKSRAVYSEVKKGDWATPYAKFRVNELTGSTAAYSDYAHSGVSGVNYAWAVREQYLFQTVISYGDLETEATAAAKIQLAADKQRSAANAIDMDSNKFNLLGVLGKEIYGALNDPNLSAPITPLSGANGLQWSAKSTQEIYDDVLALFKHLVRQTGGWVDASAPLKLVLSPELAVALGRATDFNVSALDMLHKYFSNLSIVTLPELSHPATGETMQLIASEVRGMPTAELAFSEKIRAGRVVPDISSYSQKFTAGTYGAIIYLPFAIAQMRGM